MNKFRSPNIKDQNQDPQYIRSLLKEANCGQRQAAKLLGIDERTMRRYCSGSVAVPFPVQYTLELLAFCHTHYRDQDEEEEPLTDGEAEEREHEESERQRRRERA